MLTETLFEMFCTPQMPTPVTTGITGGTSPAVSRAVKAIKEWLGKNSKVIKNKAGDLIVVSEDGARKIRVDINNPHPHTEPHAHVEELVNGTWRKSGPIYPKGSPP